MSFMSTYEGGRHAKVVAVQLNPSHSFTKSTVPSIRLLEGLGVEGDAHCGAFVKHRSRVATDPKQINLRQVHLLHAEIFSELATQGFLIALGVIGENITTIGAPLLDLPRGALLHIGEEAVVELTGLRNPCRQLDDFAPGLMAAMVARGADGALRRKAGAMAVVRRGGLVRPEDAIRVELPPLPHVVLEKV
jgi:MOSC domain-containing protein YiiM